MLANSHVLSSVRETAVILVSQYKALQTERVDLQNSGTDVLFFNVYETSNAGLMLAEPSWTIRHRI
jgi:hypothetical protein